MNSKVGDPHVKTPQVTGEAELSPLELLVVGSIAGPPRDFMFALFWRTARRASVFVELSGSSHGGGLKQVSCFMGWIRISVSHNWNQSKSATRAKLSGQS